MTPFDPRRADQVRESTDSLFKLFRASANRLFFLETVKRQPDIGSGRPGWKAQQRTRLAQSGPGSAVDSESDFVVLGYWWDGGTAFTCSGRECSLLKIVGRSEWVQQAVLKQNAWRLKRRHREFPELLRSIHSVRQAVDAPGQLKRLGRMYSLCTENLPLESAFPPWDAEGQMIARLMESKKPPRGQVDFYVTQSPCRDCANGFARLSTIHNMYREITQNPRAHQGGRRLDGNSQDGGMYSYDQFKNDYEAAGLQHWKVGWVLYGGVYQSDVRPTDWGALRKAETSGSIAGCRHLL
jgi:hypothetical protein